MPFRLTDEHVHQYHSQGFTVLRRLLPTALMSDLRREAQKGLEIARRVGGANAQRLQPIERHAELDQRRFKDYSELPELVEAVRTLIAPDAWIGGPSRMGILYEPAERPWATAWHRDFGQFQKRVDKTVFARMRTDERYFHQINCALYEDNCTWYVPGSHLRDDFDEEVRIAKDSPWQIGMDQTDLTDVELERFCLEYVERMPRAIRLHLDAGDLALYRPHGWHLGVYVPSKKRATLHDSPWTPVWKAAFDRWAAGGMMEPTPEPEPARA